MGVQRAVTIRKPGVVGRAWNRIVRHEEAPAPFQSGLSGRIALDVTVLLGLAYAAILIAFTFGRNDTFLTHAEDLGIMDQTLWNTIHGHFMIQTICNSVTDSNCFNGATEFAISRFAIHFEPILIPLSLIYLIWPSVKALLALQVVVVASGVVPVWLLATRRLRNPWWGVAFATLFLVYPPLVSAVTDDFHPETLAVTALLWAFYFLTVRRYRALIVCLALALLCKETLTLDVIGIGLFVALFHRRWRLGLGIALGAILTLALALGLMKVFSPVGHSPVTGRYSDLFHAPLATLLAMAHDSTRRAYFVKILGPVGFLPLLSPWMVAIALPSALLNLFSADPAMYSGGYQYNTDIAAVMIVAAIDGMAWLAPLIVKWLAALRLRLASLGGLRWLAAIVRPEILLAVSLLPALIVGFSSQSTRLYQLFTVRHVWPFVTTHDRLGDEIAASIPPGASVSAQSTLAPHVSHRFAVYQFPSGAYDADYVFLDVTAGDYYPFTGPGDFVSAVQATLASGDFEIATAQDGYLLLRRAPDAGSITLPASFYSFAYASSLVGVQRVDARFAGGLELVGYQINPPQVSVTEPELTVTTYWRAEASLTQPQTVVVTLTPPGGSGRYVLDDSLTQEWLPPSAWRPGQTILSQTWPINLKPTVTGEYALEVEVRDGAPDTHPPVSQSVATTLNAASGANGLPMVNPSGKGVLLAQIPLR
jgi:uncharacterized membrane protein